MGTKPTDALRRLMAPASLAFIGGKEAEVALRGTLKLGFPGKIFAVHPTRDNLAGVPTVPTVADLPEVPEAAFIAIKREPSIEVVRQLAALGTAGVVVYASGFAEVGAEGEALQQDLLDAAGDMALIGPNCYGFVNYLDQLSPWPDIFSGGPAERGVALVTQSGSMAGIWAFIGRRLPLGGIYTLGNQGQLGMAEVLSQLADDPRVSAIGLHIEGLQDVPGFVAAAQKAQKAGKPIVALKTGSSVVGSKLTESHTGSLSGSDELYSALFDKLGIIRVSSPAQLLETLKFLMVAGVPKGGRIAGFTCSGGGATMLADYGEKIGLDFAQPSENAKADLQDLLPHTATVSNPLDYTTPIWGNRERVPPVFKALLKDPFDAAVIVQDYPAAGLDDAKEFYLNDAKSFVEAVASAGIPGAVCATLPENIDTETRSFLVQQGVAPMQGLQETLDAIGAAAWLGQRWVEIEQSAPFALAVAPAGGGFSVIDEAKGKDMLRCAGVAVPEGGVCGAKDAAKTAEQLGFPVVLKMVGEKLLHKTEAGAVALNLLSKDDVEQAMREMEQQVGAFDPAAVTGRFLLEKMQPKPLAELLVSVRVDPQFGAAMTLASGGTLVELIGDAETLLLPATEAEIASALGKLKVSRLLNDFRGAGRADRAVIVTKLQDLAEFVLSNLGTICEVEVNPLFIYPADICAVDVLLTERA